MRPVLEDYSALFDGVIAALAKLRPAKSKKKTEYDWLSLLKPSEISEVLTDEVFQKDRNKKIRNR